MSTPVPTVDKPLLYELPKGKSSLLHLALPNSVCISVAEFEELWALKPAERGTVVVYGKTFEVPRTQWNLGQDYYFSGVLHKGGSFTVHPLIGRLRDFVEQHSGILGWKQCLVNFYDHGGEYIGPHSDDESQLQKGQLIYSFSFGAERKFVIHAKGGGAAVISIPLLHNTCVVMLGEMQQHFKHSVPKSAKVKERRLNITYRLYKDNQRE